ncbi:MAG: TlyA family RNA methyltransferase [bacterium]|jgi:23S rRNA (cytidine1920-2'-O)/16S rRNA (cytidine1409-2'-O)-methyltransferase
MAVTTKRLDLLLVERGLAPSRERAQARILAGEVLVDGQLTDKSGTKVRPDAEVVLLGEDLPYVSRGGLKLEKAIRCFGLNFEGKIVLDGGASTGGFTDCALQHGAAKVYAVDVGYGQLAWRLRQNPKVAVLERTNIRYLAKEQLVPLPEIACIDVSFISLEKVVPPVINVLVGEREIVALIKPQFEVGKGKVGKGGIVKDPLLHQEVLTRIMCMLNRYLSCVGLDYSPIKGAKGNIEYLVYARHSPSKVSLDVAQVIEAAHTELA